MKLNHNELDRTLASIRTINLDKLGSDLHAAIETARRHPSTADGHRATASGGNTAGGNSDLTPTEAAASSRETARLDDYDHTVQTALGYLADAERALHAARNRLATLATIQDPGNLRPTQPGCWALNRIGAWEPVHRRTIIDGEPRDLGRWAYDFHRTTGRLPSLDECRRHQDGRKIRVKT